MEDMFFGGRVVVDKYGIMDGGWTTRNIVTTFGCGLWRDKIILRYVLLVYLLSLLKLSIAFLLHLCTTSALGYPDIFSHVRIISISLLASCLPVKCNPTLS